MTSVTGALSPRNASSRTGSPGVGCVDQNGGRWNKLIVWPSGCLLCASRTLSE